MENKCQSDCNNCSKDCSTKSTNLKTKGNKDSNIKKVIGIASGKGGVGKSLITSLLATHVNKLGYKTAILDADITGPSIPKAFGITEKAKTDGESIFPVLSEKGIKLMSINLMLENSSDPVVWRGPVLAGAVNQFWNDVAWGDIDYMFIDLPPGTGDIPITVFKSLPIDGIILVTTSQELVGMIVEKAVKMAEMLDVPILGLVENMSYFVCPDCGKSHKIFGENKSAKADDFNIKFSCSLPINTVYATAVDDGKIEELNSEIIEGFINDILN